jgi:hypothetical protein
MLEYHLLNRRDALEPAEFLQRQTKRWKRQTLRQLANTKLS